MTITAVDVAGCVMGLALAMLGHYANVDAGVFMGGVWVGAFLFKLGYVCEKRWGEGGNE